MKPNRLALQAMRLLGATALLLASLAAGLAIPAPTPVAAANPTFSSISPSSGTQAGGTTVTITGTNFFPNVTVYIGAAPATNVQVISSTQITATTPAGFLGAANLLIINSDSSSVTATSAYYFTNDIGALSVTGVDPATGPAAGGTLVTISGTGFQAGATVLFGGVASTSVNLLAASTIWARSPANASGLTSVTVVNPDGTSATLADAFTYGPGGTSTVAVSSVSPSSGDTAGGTVITVNGAGFSTSGTTVSVGGNLATNVIVVSGSQLVASTPPGSAGAKTVSVTSGGQTGTLPSGFTYQSGASSAPTPVPSIAGAVTVSGVTPNLGPSTGGTTVNVTGSGFLPGATVLFGLLPGTNVTVTSSSQLTVVSPANNVATGPVSVTVVNAGGVSGALSSAFTYGSSSSALSVASILPTAGPAGGGTTVTITGTGLTGTSSVLFGGSPGSALTVASDTMLTVASPAHAVGPVAVTVVSSSGSSTTTPNGFVYTAAPAITIASITPSSGLRTGGATVTLLGTGFTSGMTVTFGGVPGASVQVLSATQATVVPPVGAAPGAVDVVVRLATGDVASLQGGYTYLAGGTVSTPLPASGFGLFVYSGGSAEQIATAAGCTSDATAAFWATGPTGEFIVYLPGTSVAAVNAAWNSLFPSGVPANTPLIGKCT
jgi:hypothetical protein